MLLRFMGKWMNSNNCCEVTDHTFAAEICQRCMFDEKNEIPHWQSGVAYLHMIFSKLYHQIIFNIWFLTGAIMANDLNWIKNYYAVIIANFLSDIHT